MDDAERRAISGRIAFVSERGAQKDIWLVEPTGVERQLTRGEEHEFPAAVSPKGDFLAVIATREIDGVHKEQLRLVGLGPGAQAQTGSSAGPEILALNPPRGRARSPSFAPDASFLVAESDERGFSHIVRLDQSGQAEFLTSSVQGDFEPRVAPDGERMAFVSSRDGNPEIYVMDARGPESGARRLTESPRQDFAPAWSPDSARIAFISDRDGRDRVYLVPASGGPARPISGDADLGAERDHAFSPDGTSLVFVGRQPDGKTRIYSVAVDRPGDAPRPLTDGAARDDQPAFSPDGKYLAYVSEPPGGQADLYLMRADGTGKTRLTTAPGADWLPRWIPR